LDCCELLEEKEIISGKVLWAEPNLDNQGKKIKYISIFYEHYD